MSKKPKCYLRKAEIFIEPKEYAKREKLPFVKAVKGKIESAWSVRPYRDDYETNNKLGYYFAILFLAHNQYADQNPGVIRLRLSDVLRDMPRIPSWHERQESDDSYNYGIEVGFLSVLEDHLFLQRYGIPAEGVSMSINLLVTGDRLRDLRNPFYDAEKRAADRKAKAEHEARELAKPANVRKLAERLKKGRTLKQILAVHKDIQKLPEGHKERERLESEWFEVAAAKGSAFFGGGSKLPARGRRAQA